MSGLTAYRASRVATLAGEGAALGRAALDAPVPFLADGVIVARNGRIVEVSSYGSFRRGPHAHAALRDLGDAFLVPGLINCHTHLELSHLCGRTTAGQGFAPWLRSLLPLACADAQTVWRGLEVAFGQLHACGTAHAGDVGSRAPDQAARARAGLLHPLGWRLGLTHFLEVFGHTRPVAAPCGTGNAFPDADGWAPPPATALSDERLKWCALSGHALYSTSAEALRAAHAWCVRRSRPFSLHLAEHADEEEALRGCGELYHMLAERVLPRDWRPPHKRPVPLARELGLLDRRTLAVHCVRCADRDVALLASCGASVCLCPRSNAFIGVGLAPAGRMADAGLLLCLGTDSLASAPSLDLQEEMRCARRNWGFSARALLRMATVNGARVLRLEQDLGALVPGRRCVFSCLAPDLDPV